MLENGTLAGNDTTFARDKNGMPMSRPEYPVLTLPGCYEMCGPKFGWNPDAGPRLTTWVIPVFLLLSSMEVSPLDKRRYLMLVHLVGDPIDSVRCLLAKLEAWSRCWRLAVELCGSDDMIKVRNLATVLGGFEEIVGFHDDPVRVYLRITNQSRTKGRHFDRLVSRAAMKLADSRTDERLRTLLAIALYGFQLISAFVTTVGGGNTSPPGGRIGIAMFLTWIVPSTLISNAIGTFTSRRTCYTILEEFVHDATGRTDAWAVLQESAPSLRRHNTVHDCLDTLAWSGGIYTYRPSKTLPFSSGSRDLSQRPLLLLAAMPVITSSVIASAIIWHTPPVGLSCRNILILSLTAAMLASAFFTHISAFFLKGSRHWHVMLVKDFLIAIPSLVLIVLACAGRFNSCWCWSAVYTLGSKARIPLNTFASFAAYDAKLYPVLVSVCLVLQLLAFVGMMWVGWRGWNVMRWSEEEKRAEWRTSRVAFG